MKWLVQSNIPNRSFEGVLSFLDHTGRDVKTIQFTEEDIQNKNIQGIVNSVGKDDAYFGPVGIFGSVKFIRFIGGELRNSFCPTIVTFDDQFDFMCRHFGDEYLNINSFNSTTNRLEELLKNTRRMFVKPVSDKKFSGVVFDIDRMSDSDTALFEELKQHNYHILVNTHLSKLKREMRFWVIDGKIVAQSQYVLEGLVEPDPVVSYAALEYANKVKDLCPLLAYTLDIAEVEGVEYNYFKVIEINCVNSSGFYDADDKSIVEALEAIDITDCFSLVNHNDKAVCFDDDDFNRPLTDSPQYDIWIMGSPFKEEYLNWFKELNYEPRVQLYDESVGWYRVPLHSVTNDLFGRCEYYDDAVIIDDPTVKMLYKLTWV